MTIHALEARGAGGEVLHRVALDPDALHMDIPPGLAEVTWTLHFLDADGQQVGCSWVTPWGLAMLQAKRA